MSDPIDDPMQHGPLDRDPSEGGEVLDAGPAAEHGHVRPSVSTGDTGDAVDDAARGTGLPESDDSSAGTDTASTVDPHAADGLA